jgi:putative RNase toxin 24 of polymorphic toxin system
MLGTMLAGIGAAVQRFWDQHGDAILQIGAILATDGLAAEEGPAWKLQPNAAAEGPHTTFSRNPTTGEVMKYESYRPQTNSQNPNSWESTGRFDKTGDPHYNKATKESVPTPHVHDPSTPGGVRSARPDEIPRTP